MRYRAVLVVPLALVLGVAGCGTAPVAPAAPATPTALSADYGTVDGEYQQARTQLKLPAGISFPAHLPDTAGHYLPGSGANQAQTFWLCAWLDDYLKAPADPTRAKAAYAQVSRYPTMTAYAGLQPEGRAQVDAAIGDVRQGQVGKVGQFTVHTCGGPFYGHATG